MVDPYMGIPGETFKSSRPDCEGSTWLIEALAPRHAPLLGSATLLRSPARPGIACRLLIGSERPAAGLNLVHLRRSR
jgi:hypothetical protein